MRASADRLLSRREAGSGAAPRKERVGRLLGALRTADGRRQMLGLVRVPALVVHGVADPFIPPSEGIATAAVLAEAELLLVPGMGHQLPAEMWHALLAAMERTMLRAEWASHDCQAAGI